MKPCTCMDTRQRRCARRVKRNTSAAEDCTGLQGAQRGTDARSLTAVTPLNWARKTSVCILRSICHSKAGVCR